MTRFLKFIPALLLTAVIISPVANAATEAGTALLVSGSVEAVSQDGQTRVVKRRSTVYEGEEIRTGADSRAQIKMVDGALISLKPNTELQISSYQYSKDAESNSVVMNLVSGGLRTVSGAIGKGKQDSYRLDTPMGSIGIRGTDYEVEIPAEK